MTDKIRLIAVTQRTIIDDSGEIRDGLARDWSRFFEKSGIMPILLPNNISLVKDIFTKLKIDGILLTGGGNIKSCGGNDFEREEVEEYLINYSKSHNLPLFGVCRGMQKIQDYFGIKIHKVEGHIAKEQEITINGERQIVNSFHNFGTKENNDEFAVFAKADDGIIKGIKHKRFPITAIMWHPERFDELRLWDLNLFGEIYK